jgi:uncharacterized phage protein gp47/JayE
MAIAGQSFASFRASIVASVKAAASSAIDFTVGSVPLALAEAVSAVALWLQALILRVLAQSRASTSQGPDLDTWMADFSFARLAAAAATGQLSFARFQPTAAAVIPVGSFVAATIGGAQFQVTGDPTNPAYNATAANGAPGYLVPAGVASQIVPGAAVTPGSAGNVLPSTISLLLQQVSGIDTVTNPGAFVGGTDPEPDAAFRTRFQAFINSLMKGTDAAIAYALNALQSGLTFQILENTTPALTVQNGYVTVCLDDGSGNPPNALIQAALAAIEAVRCAGIIIGVIPPRVVPVNAVMSLTSLVTVNHAADVAAATNALTAYLDALPVGGTLPFSRLAQLAYDSSPNISNVTGVQLSAVVPSAGGTGNAVGDVLTLSNGVTVKLTAASGGAVMSAQIQSLGSVTGSAAGLAVTSTTGSGTGAVFALTLSSVSNGGADLAVSTISVVKAGTLSIS